MTSLPIRDPLADHLITPQNAALIVIDFQQNQVRSVRSMDSGLLLENVVSTVKVSKLFGPSDRAFHRRGRRRPGSVNAPGARRPTRGLPADRVA